ncbi:Gfo/Idh/MocA family protein [Microbacterium sp. NPDC055521]
MAFTMGLVGAGQFAGQFATLFHHHPGISGVHVTDVVPSRASDLVTSAGLAGTFDSFAEMVASPAIDAIAIFTQRWMHGPLVVEALRAGKHVYSAVPMAMTVDEIGAIIDAVRETGLTYMMGETSYYNPATVYARQKLASGEFGQLFYGEGDYIHDMDLGFYEAYQYSGGAEWKSTASYPPLLYPTHSIGGVLGAWPTHAVAVSAIGVTDQRGDGVFERGVSQFDNDFSNSTALFEVAGGGSMRINEFRRVGYPSHLRESRFRWFGTEGSFEQIARTTVWQTRQGLEDISHLIDTDPSASADDPALSRIAPALRDAFVSGYAAIHEQERARIPVELQKLPNGHEGSHHFLVDDFVRAVTDQTLPPVNAWQAARFTLPGVMAHESARLGGERLMIPDMGQPHAR